MLASGATASLTWRLLGTHLSAYWFVQLARVTNNIVFLGVQALKIRQSSLQSRRRAPFLMATSLGTTQRYGEAFKLLCFQRMGITPVA